MFRGTARMMSTEEGKINRGRTEEVRGRGKNIGPITSVRPSEGKSCRVIRDDSYSPRLPWLIFSATCKSRLRSPSFIRLRALLIFLNSRKPLPREAQSSVCS